MDFLEDSYKKIHDILKNEILYSYLAGIIDGEGCIGIYHNSHNKNYQLRITIEMVDIEAMLLFEKMFGGKWYIQKAKIPRKERRKIMLFNKSAEQALQKVFPYLRIKKQHAKEVLKADWSSYVGGKKLSINEINIRKEIYHKIKKLNSRGYYGKEGHKS